MNVERVGRWIGWGIALSIPVALIAAVVVVIIRLSS